MLIKIRIYAYHEKKMYKNNDAGKPMRNVSWCKRLIVYISDEI